MKLFRIIFFGGFMLYACTLCGGLLAMNLFVPITALSDVWGAAHLYAYGDIQDYDKALLYTGGPVTWSGHIGAASFACGSPVAEGYLTSGFDHVRVTESGHEVRHGGTDYGTNQRAQSVSASMGGQVVFAGWSDVGYGFLVVVENQGVQQYAAHLSEVGVQVGDTVAAGETVGVSGNTGNSSGPHVHVEFRQQVVGADGIARGVPFNPRTNFAPGQTAVCGWD